MRALHLLLALLALGAATCARAQNVTTLASALAALPELSTLVVALPQCPDLQAAATNTSTAFTFFAPTDQAIAAALVSLNMTATDLFSNNQLMCEVLAYHMVPMPLGSSDASDDAVVLPTLLPGNNITVQEVLNGIYVNNARVIRADIPAGNSIIHILDQVLLQDGVAQIPTVTLANVASNVPDLTTLVELAAIAPLILATAMDPRTQVTLFAPTNQAFDAVLPIITRTLDVTAEQVLSNSEFLTAILAYHMVPEPILSTAVGANTLRYNSLLPPARISLRRNGRYVLVNRDTRVLTADVRAGRSVVHVINRVLLPTGWATYWRESSQMK